MPRRDVRIYSNILNVGYIFIEGVEVGGWVILMFFLGGGEQNAKEKRLLYIESPDFKSPHVFISAYIIYHQVFPNEVVNFTTLIIDACLDGSYFLI